MNRSIIISSVLHAALIFITAMSLPFLAKKGKLIAVIKIKAACKTEDIIILLFI